MDIRGKRQIQDPITINGSAVERVLDSIKFLGVHITKDLTWEEHTNTKHLRLKEFCLWPKILQGLLQRHNREHLNRIHHNLVRELQCPKPQNAAKGSADS